MHFSLVLRKREEKKPKYFAPQKRMVHFMDVLANALTRFLQSKYSTLDIWKGPFSQIEESLQTVRNDILLPKL